MNEETKQRIIKSMEWMIADMKWRHDENRGNLEEGSQGGYSPDLQEAVSVLAELEQEG